MQGTRSRTVVGWKAGREKRQGNDEPSENITIQAPPSKTSLVFIFRVDTNPQFSLDNILCNSPCPSSKATEYTTGNVAEIDVEAAGFVTVDDEHGKRFWGVFDFREEGGVEAKGEHDFDGLEDVGFKYVVVCLALA